MTDTMKQEYTLRISQANRTELTVIVYEMLLCYMKEAEQKYDANLRDEYRNAIKKAINCTRELLSSLDYEYEIAMGLAQLYHYVEKELILADALNKKEGIKNAEMVITGLQQSYATLGKEDKSAPIMQNTQAVYAGLTYGKKELTESLDRNGGSRGFCV